MNLENIEAISQNPVVVIPGTAGTIGVANADKIAEIIITARWYDVWWTPIWEILPWSQMATVIGTPLLAYSVFVTIKNALKNK